MSSSKQQASTMESNMRDGAACAADAAKTFGADVKHAAQEKFEHLRESAQEYVDEGRKMAGQYMDEGRKRAVELEHTIESQIRRQPLKSLLAATACGFLLGMFFVRK